MKRLLYHPVAFSRTAREQGHSTSVLTTETNSFTAVTAGHNTFPKSPTEAEIVKDRQQIQPMMSAPGNTGKMNPSTCHHQGDEQYSWCCALLSQRWQVGTLLHWCRHLTSERRRHRRVGPEEDNGYCGSDIRIRQSVEMRQFILL